MADFVPNFAAMATGVGRSTICLASFSSPTLTPLLLYARFLVNISYIGRVMADYVPNLSPWQRGLVAVEFVWRHSIAQPRTPLVIRKASRGYLLYSPSYSRFCLKFCCHDNKLRSS